MNSITRCAASKISAALSAGSRAGPSRSFTSKSDYILHQVGRPTFSRKGGIDIVHDPLLNKGTSFSIPERDRMHIRGLVPPRLASMQEQLVRVEARYRQIEDDLEKYLYLIALQDRNEVLFYKFLSDKMEELAPIIYTPTVGVACQKFGALYRRPRGMYFTSADIGQMSSMIYNWPSEEVDVIVVTDGGRILGLGDLGANGMGIPIGKLSLYVAGGGIHPGRVLPIFLDVGTNNEALLQDPLYLGLPQRRLEGDEYWAVVDEFMNAIRTRWPKALIQFEDFTTSKAYPVLEKYRKTDLCFNDDIQGTGAVVLAGLLNALRAQGKSTKNLTEQRIVMLGAGGAGLGVADAICEGMTREGMTPEQAAKNFWMVDVNGLLTQRRSALFPGQERYARHGQDIAEGASLADVIRHVKPTVLLGLSGTGGMFTKEVVTAMAENCERPIIFPLSNPTSKSECTFEQAIKWTDGRCLFASGSPFEPIEYNGTKFFPGQANNMFIFPGVGLGVVSVGSKRVTAEMFYEAVKALALSVPDSQLQAGKIYPSISEIRRVSRNIAVAVARNAIARGLATRPMQEEELVDMDSFMEKQMWTPEYNSLVYLP